MIQKITLGQNNKNNLFDVVSVSWSNHIARKFHLVAAGCSDGFVRIIQIFKNTKNAMAIDWKLVFEAKVHSHSVSKIKWNHNATSFLSVDQNGNIYLWKRDKIKQNMAYIPNQINQQNESEEKQNEQNEEEMNIDRNMNNMNNINDGGFSFGSFGNDDDKKQGDDNNNIGPFDFGSFGNGNNENDGNHNVNDNAFSFANDAFANNDNFNSNNSASTSWQWGN